jgi:arylformamidase
MPIFPGDPAPSLQRAEGAQAPWSVAALRLGSHTGTHIDAPSHYFAGGRTIDQFEVHRFVVPGVVLPALGLGEDRAIGAEHLAGMLSALPKGGGAVIWTEWSRCWGTERYLRHPYLSAEAAWALVDAGAGLVAIDALNVDSTVRGTSHAHEILLGHDVLIVENLAGLAQLRPGGVYQFSFLPLFLRGLDGSPVRAVAVEGGADP